MNEELIEVFELPFFRPIGLPRVVQEGGLVISGRFFPPGSILSVPIYSIHHDESVWGTDADAFRWVMVPCSLITKYIH